MERWATIPRREQLRWHQFERSETQRGRHSHWTMSATRSSR
jgi:hypothetical protein